MNVVIVGAGGHGRVVLDILRAAGQYQPVGFLDADIGLTGLRIGEVEVLGHTNLSSKLLRSRTLKRAIIAIGDNRTRLGFAQQLREQGFELVNAIHPRAHLASGVDVGRNVVIAAGAMVCTQVKIADSAIINTGAIVDHECQIGRGVHIAPGAALAGRVRVEEGAFIGLGARVIQRLNIGPFATVGAGAVVLEDVPAEATVVGVPARRTPPRDPNITA